MSVYYSVHNSETYHIVQDRKKKTHLATLVSLKYLVLLGPSLSIFTYKLWPFSKLTLADFRLHSIKL